MVRIPPEDAGVDLPPRFAGVLVDDEQVRAAVAVTVGHVDAGGPERLDVAAQVRGETGGAAPVDVRRHVVRPVVAGIAEHEVGEAVLVQVPRGHGGRSQGRKLGAARGREPLARPPVDVGRDARVARRRRIGDRDVDEAVAIEIAGRGKPRLERGKLHRTIRREAGGSPRQHVNDMVTVAAADSNGICTWSTNCQVLDK